MKEKKEFYTMEEFLEELKTPFTLWERVRYGVPRFFSDLYWAIKHRIIPKHKYHIIRTGLKPGYYDPDTRILHCIFSEVYNWAEYNNPIIAENEEYVSVYDRPLTLKDDGEWLVNEKNGRTSHFIGDQNVKLLVDAAEWWGDNKDKFFDEYGEEGGFDMELKKHLGNIIQRLDYLWY